MKESRSQPRVRSGPDSDGQKHSFQDSVQLAKLVQHFPAAQPARPRTVALMSSNRREGTTTCTVNLARYLAESWPARVLMVDANLRHPALHLIAGVENHGGLTELLQGDIELEPAIKTTALPHLFVLTSGGPAVHPNQLLTVPALEERLLRGARSFDFVIFDCAPVNFYAEATSVAASCDGVVLVVEAGRTRRQAAQKAKTLLRQASCNVLGVFMNKRKFHIPKFIYDRL